MTKASAYHSIQTAFSRIAGLIAISFTLLPAALPAVEQAIVDQTLKHRLLEALADRQQFGDRFDAEVWLVDMAHRLKTKVDNENQRLDLLKHIHFEAKRAKLPPELVLAVIDVESNFDRFAISEAGARGLMQVMPFWLKELGRPEDNLFDQQTNLRFGCTILRYYLEMANGNLTEALARYNGSFGSKRYPNKVFTALRNRWRRE